jgi:hypothetical protein
MHSRKQEGGTVKQRFRVQNIYLMHRKRMAAKYRNPSSAEEEIIHMVGACFKPIESETIHHPSDEASCRYDQRCLTYPSSIYLHESITCINIHH